MKKLLIILLAIVLISTTLLVACDKEIVYVYIQTGGSSGNNGEGGNSNGNTSGGSSSSGSSSSGGNTSGGSSSSGSSTVTDDGSTYNLTVWCAEEDYIMINEMLAEYKVLHSKNTYNFKVEKVGEDVVSSSVTRDVNAAADIFSFANDQLGILRNQDALYQIPNEYKDQIEDQIDVAITSCKEGGKYYGIPYSYENTFLYYNKSKVSENDVKSLETLLSKSIPGVEHNLGIDMADSYYTTTFLYTAGVEIFGTQGIDANSVDLANDKAVKACQYIQWLGKQDKLKSIVKADQTAALKQGSIAAMISGPHMISQFKDALGDNFGVAMLPTIKLDEKDTQLVSFSGIKMYGISNKPNNIRSAKDTAEACRVAAFLANDDNQQIRLEQREFCPTQVDLFETAVGSGSETVKVVVDQSEYSNLKPGVSRMSAYWTPMANFLQGVYSLNKKESVWLTELKAIEQKILES